MDSTKNCLKSRRGETNDRVSNIKQNQYEDGSGKTGSKTLINYDRFVEFLNGGGDDGAGVD